MSAISHRASKRRRRRHNQPGTYQSISSAEEQRFLNQAIQSAKLGAKRDEKLEVPYAPTFYPTVEEMEGNPMHYISKIKEQGEKYGIVKIVPPKGWKAPFCKLSMYFFYRFLYGVGTLAYVSSSRPSALTSFCYWELFMRAMDVWMVFIHASRAQRVSEEAQWSASVA